MGKDSVGITPTKIYLKDTIFGLAGNTMPYIFEFRKKDYAPGGYYLPSQYLMPKTWVCCFGGFGGCLLAIPLRFGSMYKHQDNVEIKLLKWTEYAKVQVSKLKNKNPAIRLEATHSFLDFNQDAIEAIEYLIESFPQITDEQTLILSEPGDPDIEQFDYRYFGSSEWITRQQNEFLNLTISLWKEEWKNCISIHDYKLGLCETKETVDPLSRVTGHYSKTGHYLIKQWYYVYYTIHLGAKALELITGQNFGPNKEQWRQWWKENKTHYKNP